MKTLIFVQPRGGTMKTSLVMVGILLAGSTGAATKIAVCHRSPKNPTSFQIIQIAAGSAASHLNHGDHVIGPEVCDGIDNDCNAQIDDGGVCPECHPFFANGPGFSCPTGATEFCYAPPLDPSSSDQARKACEDCYGQPCYLESADCAGFGWGPNPADSYVCGDAYFGFEAGCSGSNGRAWSICSSGTTYGYWGY